MTNKALIDALERRPAGRVPFWFMRQAGRYLPEYRELRAKKNGFMDLASDAVAACEVTMQPIRRFGMDGAVLFSDILVIPHALGQKLEFLEGEGPKLEPVRNAADISRLSHREFNAKLAPVYEAQGLVKTALRNEGFAGTAAIGFAGAPWTLACYMVEGGSSRDFIEVKKMAYTDPENFGRLIDLLVECVATHLVNQITAGAEAVQIFDSWSGVLDVDQFRRWVIEPTKQVVATVRASYPNIPIIGFPRAAGANYQAYVQDTGISGVGLDTQVPTRWAARTLQPLATVQGNLDPVCLLAGGDAMLLAAERIIAELGSGPFIFNLGHGVHKDTPVAHVEMLVAHIRNHKL